MPLTEAQSELVVRLAREAVENHVGGASVARPKWNDPFLSEFRGTFVTLKTTEGALRGCIGFPYPVKQLGDAVVDAAVAAAASDPRFEGVGADELNRILVEVSVLTAPERISYSSPKDLPRMIRAGVDGLIVSDGGANGLLLPQVAMEYGMSSEDFLSHTCLKAGLMPDAWLAQPLVVQRFQAEVFTESAPRGPVNRELT